MWTCGTLHVVYVYCIIYVCVRQPYAPFRHGTPQNPVPDRFSRFQASKPELLDTVVSTGQSSGMYHQFAMDNASQSHDLPTNLPWQQLLLPLPAA